MNEQVQDPPELNATVIVHWPGKDVAACPEHSAKLQRLASVMGFPLTATPCLPTLCRNCINERVK